MNRKYGLYATAMGVVALLVAGGSAMHAQDKWIFSTNPLAEIRAYAAEPQEKRTIYTEDNFHWQGKLAPGQTLEVIDTNGGIDASGSGDDSSQVNGEKRGHGDEMKEAYVEVVEYSDGVTICAVYARTPEQGRCQRGGVHSDSFSGLWHNSRARIAFSLKVARGVNVKTMTTNGDIRATGMNSVVDASTTNGSIDVSTTEWASGRSTNGHIDLSMGKAAWSGELHLATTNGGISVALPSSAAFDLRASTTNGSIHTDFPVTVEGTFGPKNVSGTVGGGGRQLRLATTNGGIEIKKSGA
jgi:putative adhesin